MNQRKYQFGGDPYSSDIFNQMADMYIQQMNTAQQPPEEDVMGEQEVSEDPYADYNPEFDELKAQYDDLEARFNQLQEQMSWGMGQSSLGDGFLDFLFSDDATRKLPTDFSNLPDNFTSYTPLRHNAPAPTGSKKGSVAVRHNNPGNLKYADWMQKYGAVPGDPGTDGGRFARFPDVESGLAARTALLKGSTYSNLSFDAAMRRYSNNGYGAEIYPEIKGKRMSELTDAELQELTRRQIRREDADMASQLGYQYGGVARTSPAFERWYRKNTREGLMGIPSNDPLHSFDYRMYYDDLMKGKAAYVDPHTDDHYLDTYKFPSHPSFSVESRYFTNIHDMPHALSYDGDFRKKINYDDTPLGRKYQTGGYAGIAFTEREQRKGLNNPAYDEMYFPMEGENIFRGLDSGEPVYLRDGSGNEQVLYGPHHTARMKGNVYEMRLSNAQYGLFNMPNPMNSVQGGTVNRTYLSSKEQAAEKAVADARKKRIAKANAARNASFKNIHEWTDNLATSTSAISDKLRLSPNPNLFDDNPLNPIPFIAGMAENLGRIPQDILLGNTQRANSSFAEPVLTGSVDQYLGMGARAAKRLAGRAAEAFRPKVRYNLVFDDELPNYLTAGQIDARLSQFVDEVDPGDMIAAIPARNTTGFAHNGNKILKLYNNGEFREASPQTFNKAIMPSAPAPSPPAPAANTKLINAGFYNTAGKLDTRPIMDAGDPAFFAEPLDRLQANTVAPVIFKYGRRPNSLDQINRTNFMSILGDNIARGGAHNKGVYDLKGFPEHVLKFENAHKTAQTFYMPDYKNYNMAELSKGFVGNKRLGAVAHQFDTVDDGIKGLVVNKVSNLPVYKFMDPAGIANLPDDAIANLYADLKQVRNNNMLIDFFGGNFGFNPNTRSFTAFDFTPYNPQARTKLERMGHVFNDVFPDDTPEFSGLKLRQGVLNMLDANMESAFFEHRHARGKLENLQDLLRARASDIFTKMGPYKYGGKYKFNHGKKKI